MWFRSNNPILVKNINDDIIKVPRTIVGMMCKTLKHMVKAIEKPKFFDIPKKRMKRSTL